MGWPSGLVDAHLDNDRLDGPHRIGVDEICYRNGRTFLTIVTDHDTGRFVHIAEGHTSATLTASYDLRGSERRARIRAVSMEMTRICGEQLRA